MVDSAEATAIAGIFIAIVGTIGIPAWRRWSINRKKYDETQVDSWAGMNRALREERDHIQNRLDAEEQRHRQQIKDLEEEFETRTLNMRRRISELETEVQALHMSLRSLGGTL